MRLRDVPSSRRMGATLVLLGTLHVTLGAGLVLTFALVVSVPAPLAALVAGAFWVVGNATCAVTAIELLGRTQLLARAVGVQDASAPPPSPAAVSDALAAPLRATNRFLLTIVAFALVVATALIARDALQPALCLALTMTAGALGTAPLLLRAWRDGLSGWLAHVSAAEQIAREARLKDAWARSFALPVGCVASLSGAALVMAIDPASRRGLAAMLAWAALTAAAVLVSYRRGRFLGRVLAIDVHSIAENVSEIAHHHVMQGADRPQPRVTATDLARETRTIHARKLALAYELLSKRFADLSEREETARTSVEQLKSVKTQFVASMSHDLRSPLNSIIGFSDMLLGAKPTSLNDAQRESVTSIRQAAGELMRVLTDLLDTARLEAGRLPLRKAWAPSVEILTQAVSRGHALTEGRPIRLIAELQPGLPPVFADTERIVQAVEGILERAIFAMERGTVRLRASVANGPPGPPKQIRVEIIDAGAALRETDRATIFEAFRQLREPSSKHGGRLGLGLSLSRALVVAHGGDIWCESREGEGTKFTIALPLDGKAGAP